MYCVHVVCCTGMYANIGNARACMHACMHAHTHTHRTIVDHRHDDRMYVCMYVDATTTARRRVVVFTASSSCSGSCSSLSSSLSSLQLPR